MLGIDGTVKSNRMAVIRSSSAVVVSSQNANREWVYSQQQTVSAEGYSGQAFNPHFPHTTSGVGTTKNCTDCHLSKQNDNNAMDDAIARFRHRHGEFLRALRLRRRRHRKDFTRSSGRNRTNRRPPSAVICTRFAYPTNYEKHLDSIIRNYRRAIITTAKTFRIWTLRGEYLYTANGPGGFEVFDVANIDQKGFSERIVSSPVSPLGQRTVIKTPYATSIALPSTLGIDPGRTRLPENEEQKIHPLYAYAYVTDREEGLVIVPVATLVDGNPANNFLQDKIIFNPEKKLKGATHCVVAGHRIFLTAEQGLFVIDINDPEHPTIIAEITSGFFREPRAVAVQFRYAFITDADGLKVVNITDPSAPLPVPAATLRLQNAQRFYLARTYAYVANGSEGLAIIDIENPEQPRLASMFNAGGELNDVRAVQVGSVNASEFALVADGRNGLRVIQLISPENVPEHMGFSPLPNPRLIATFPTKSPALAISRGLDRDRVVDETGNQTVVFGRRGARPFNQDEMKKFYQPTRATNSNSLGIYTVEDVENREGI